MTQNSRRLQYVQLDVFTHTPLEGNQLAVFPDARGLSTDDMQALARETNFSETTFIVPREAEVERERGVQVRIFTVAEELPFAGHPTLGTAYYLHTQRGGDVALELKVGKIPVRFFSDELGRTVGEMRQRDPEFGAVHPAEEVAAAIGVTRADIDDSVPIQTVSTGMAFTIVPLRSLKTLQTIQFSWARAAEYLERSDGKFFYLVSRETVSPEATLHARMIFYNGEDPATGSAAGCCTGWAVMHGVFGSGQQCAIEQGLEMKRPSWIRARASKVGNAVTDVMIGGGTIEVLRGEVFV